MYRSLYPRDMLAEIERLQRDMQQAFDLSPTIRGIARNGFPALNVGGTPSTIEIYAFAPGVDPATLELGMEMELVIDTLFEDEQADHVVWKWRPVAR